MRVCRRSEDHKLFWIWLGQVAEGHSDHSADKLPAGVTRDWWPTALVGRGKMNFFYRKWWIVVAINVVVAGAVVGVCYYLGPESKLVALLTGIARQFPWVTHLSGKSQMGVFGEIYYMMTLPVVPASALAFYRSMIHSADGGYSEWASDTFKPAQRVAAVPLGLIVVAFAIAASFGMEGQNVRYLRIGDSMLAMSTQGWMPFCAVGSAIGFGVALIRKFFLD